MLELRLLTKEAKRTRYDFVWMVEGCKLPVLAVGEADRLLRLILTDALRMHGALDFGLGRM